MSEQRDYDKIVEEMKEFVLRPIEIKTTVYERLERIAQRIKLPPNQTVENLINDVYNYLHKEGKI